MIGSWARCSPPDRGLRFTVAVGPANAGAVLLRTGDQSAGYQSVQMNVDGTRLPDWVQPLANTSHPWLDDVYQLPGSVTGRPLLAVTLTPDCGSPAWSATGYRVLSLVRGTGWPKPPHC